MFRKIFFMLFAVICFMSTITTNKVLSATPITKDAPQLRYYDKQGDNYDYSIYVLRYSEEIFNIELDVTKKNYSHHCSFKSICIQNDKNFICQGNATKKSSDEQAISGTITPYVIDILKSDGNEICKDNAPLIGHYDLKFIQNIEGPTTKTITVTPISKFTEGADEYVLKDKNGEDFTLENTNYIDALDKFHNKWIDIEYFTYPFYADPPGQYIYYNVMYKINGKNPMEIK